MISARKAILILTALALLAVPVCAVNANVSVKVDTTVVNSTFLDVNIWFMITLIGIGLMILSNLTGKETGAPIWATLSPFFTFASMWFSTSLDYMQNDAAFNATTGIYTVLSEHMVYHLDWAAIGLFGIVFIFSFVNVWYIIFKKPLDKPKREDIYGNDRMQ